MDSSWLVLAVVALCLVEASIIAALLVERRRLRRVAEALCEGEDRSAALLRAAPDLMFLLSADGVYLDYHTSRADDLFVPPEQFLGRNMRDVLPPDLAERFAAAVREALDSGEPQSVDYALPVGSRVRYYEARIVATGAGTMLSVVRDVTEQRTSEAELARLANRLLRLQDEERRRVAAELHDGLGQSLSIIRNRAAICLRDPSDADRVSEHLSEIAATASAAIGEVRDIAHNLRPFDLDRLGLAEAIRTMADRVSSAAGIRVTADVDLTGVSLPPEDETTVYRIVQEALNNVVRHAAATEARVTIACAGRDLVVTVGDNGKGIVATAGSFETASGKGIGLADIAQRARMLGGSLAIGTPPGGGTSLAVMIPVSTWRDGD